MSTSITFSITLKGERCERNSLRPLLTRTSLVEIPYLFRLSGVYFRSRLSLRPLLGSCPTCTDVVVLRSSLLCPSSPTVTSPVEGVTYVYWGRECVGSGSGVPRPKVLTTRVPFLPRVGGRRPRRVSTQSTILNQSVTGVKPLFSR